MPLPPDQIRVVNVRPAYDASLARGVAPDALADIGLSAIAMADPDAAVTGAATYAHFELMQQRPGFDRFLVDAVDGFGPGSLGVVGLACKTLPTVGDALRCHARFQHLTNRTARYQTRLEGDVLWLEEERFGPDRAGKLALSDYTLLVAVRLLSLVVEGPVPVVGARSRRRRVSAEERAVLEDRLGPGLELGRAAPALGIPADWLATPVATADPELAAYFGEVLRRAAPTPESDDAWLRSLRAAIQARLPGGDVTRSVIARDLATSVRTLQRRLADRGRTFAEVRTETRRALAEAYLRDADLGLAEVAWLLGYQTDTSFHRAFRR
ncbi:MAG: AraC family transcriptional regulator ligand-binding domain-containing protein, partial [Myxococcota bacterium]